jgi:transcriptional regulator GlxA family with amidase domain
MLQRMRMAIAGLLLTMGCHTSHSSSGAQTSATPASSSTQATPNDVAPIRRLPAPTPPQRIPVAFVVTHDAEVVDFGGPWGVFEYVFLPGYHDPVFQLYTVSDRPGPVKVSGGLQIVPDYTFDNAPQPKVVVVPAQGEPSEAELAWLRSTAPNTDLTMSVCTGAFVLAKAGLLDGKPATTHHGAYASFAAEFPSVKMRRGARFVDADGISSAGGLTSGIDLALHVVERYFGRELAEKTATNLEYQGQGWKNPDANVAFATRPVSTPSHPICPVCEMEVDPKTALHETYKRHEYYFCSEDDKATFDKAPARFVDSDSRSPR